MRLLPVLCPCRLQLDSHVSPPARVQHLAVQVSGGNSNFMFWWKTRRFRGFLECACLACTTVVSSFRCWQPAQRALKTWGSPVPRHQLQPGHLLWFQRFACCPNDIFRQLSQPACHTERISHGPSESESSRSAVQLMLDPSELLLDVVGASVHRPHCTHCPQYPYAAAFKQLGSCCTSHVLSAGSTCSFDITNIMQR